jgi:predicted ester cyclase
MEELGTGGKDPMGDIRRTVDTYWATAQARDWRAFGATLADDVRYELPQTGERISGRDGVVRFHAEYPGEWSLEIERVIAEGEQAVAWIRFTVDEMFAEGGQAAGQGMRAVERAEPDAGRGARAAEGGAGQGLRVGGVPWEEPAAGGLAEGDEHEACRIAFFTFAPDRRIQTIADFWPAPYEPPAGREHLVERPRRP